MFSCKVQSFSLKISDSCVPAHNVGLRATQQKTLSVLHNFSPYCSLETNLMTYFAASLKLSTHTLTHNYPEPQKLFEGFKRVPIFVFLMK